MIKKAKNPSNHRETLGSEAEALIGRIRKNAANLYETRQLLCTEAVLAALNQSLDGGLSENQAVALAAPFCIGLGESGCICGALSGAILAIGLLIGGNQPYRRRRDLRDYGRQLHDSFKTAHGATCCRVLSSKVKHNKKAHFRQCTELTADAAEMAARLILEKRPELIKHTSSQPPVRQEPLKVGGALSRLYRFFSH